MCSIFSALRYRRYLIWKICFNWKNVDSIDLNLFVLSSNFCFLVLNVAEASKWEKITYLGIVACSSLAVFILSKGHAHYDEPPVRILFRCIDLLLFFFVCVYLKNAMIVDLVENSVVLIWYNFLLQAYPYLHIRNKEFPWGEFPLLHTIYFHEYLFC